MFKLPELHGHSNLAVPIRQAAGQEATSKNALRHENLMRWAAADPRRGPSVTKKFEFIDRLHARMAMGAIGRSTLRSQGAPGMVAYARQFLREVDIKRFGKDSHADFRKVLNAQTLVLARGFPADGRGNWGAARKSLNIFLRDVVYSRHLCDHYKLAHIEPWLEVPLDSNVHEGLAGDWGQAGKSVPPWPGVKALTPKDSAKLQRIASDIADSLGVARVHLDVRYWRKDAIDALEGGDRR